LRHERELFFTASVVLKSLMLVSSGFPGGVFARMSDVQKGPLLLFGVEVVLLSVTRKR
jgi:hypothetical protein